MRKYLKTRSASSNMRSPHNEGLRKSSRAAIADSLKIQLSALDTAGFSPREPDRGGSTLLIVVALLGMLAFLGFVFYTFAKQERANAVTFSQGAQTLKAPALEPDSLFDFALQQLILGPSDAYFQSVLWGGRSSLLANMFGRDGIPWNGEGVNLVSNLGQPHVDLNFDGAPDATDGLLNFVDSPATGLGAWAGNAFNSIPAPDVNYNSPNIDSLFLSYDGIALDPGNTPFRVVIPSFLRPQYMRYLPAGATKALAIPNWYSSDGSGGTIPSTTAQVFRPHPSHICVDGFGNVITTKVGSPQVDVPVPRFVSINESYNGLPMYRNLGLRRPFDSSPLANQFIPLNADGTASTGYLGVWNVPLNINPLDINLDVDSDGDGVLDAVLMDLGHPPIRRGDGKLVVPLFAISVRDLNGLLNVNAAGNLSGNINLDPTSPLSLAKQNNQFGAAAQLGFRPVGSTAVTGGTRYNFTPDNLSKSNQGMTTYEINIQRALTADPITDSQLRDSETGLQLSYFLKMFDNSVTTSPPQPGRSSAELANLEWLFANIGRPHFHLGLASTSTPSTLVNAITDIFAGRNGETTQALFTSTPVNSVSANSGPIWSYALSSTSPPQEGTPATPFSFPPQSTDILPASLSRFLTTQNPFDLPKPGLSITWNTNSNPPYPFSWPPVTPVPPLLPVIAGIDSDDTTNPHEGEPNSASNLRWVNPLDFRGTGRHFQSYQWGADAQPGQPNIDDDGNGTIDDFSEEGWVVNGSTLTDGMPLYGKSPELVNLPNSPLYFPAYSGFHSYWIFKNPFFAATNGGVILGDQTICPTYYDKLMRGSVWTSLLDDPSETIVDLSLTSPKYSAYLNYLTSLSPPGAVANPPNSLLTKTVVGVSNSVANDAVFSAEEMLFLQGSSADARSSDSRSRLAELMPGNLVASQSAGDIRKRLTTVSQDRREFGATTSLVGGVRSWEINLANPATTPIFPPATNNQTGRPSPFRSELFRFLQQYAPAYLQTYYASLTASPLNFTQKEIQQFFNTGSASLKLDVNRLLFLTEFVDNAGVDLGDQYGFMELPAQTSTGNLQATIARQNMARDIYTLLYTFCHVHSSGTTFDVDYRTATTKPTASQAKEMAQFAINLVDSLDTDNIITAFYYKPDLTDAASGWGTSNYYGPDGIQNTSDDSVVFGVERQLLAINETVAFRVKTATVDSPMTIFDDAQTANTGRAYLFFELQNVSPMNVPLAPATAAGATAATALTTADWRVRLTNPDLSTEYSILYFLPGLDTANNLLQPDTAPSGNLILPSGALFTVSSQDGTDKFGSGEYRTSDFRASNAGDGNQFELVVPATGPNGATDTAGGKTVPTKTSGKATFPTPKCNLDLVWDYGDAAKRFVLKSDLGPGNFVKSFAGDPAIRLHLERRVADGGVGGIWAVVDKSSNATNSANPAVVDVLVGDITPPTPPPAVITPAMVSGQLANINSYARTVPLLRNGVTPTPSANTINTASTATSPIVWQLQYDRHFASVAELLELPLYGPDELTNGRLQNAEFYKDTTSVNGTTTWYPTVAAARFLRPDNPDYIENSAMNNPGNRWYRLLNFLEVPDRSNRHQAIVGIPPAGAATFGNTDKGFGFPVSFFTNATSPAGTLGSTAYSSYMANTGVGVLGFTPPFGLPQYYGWPRTQGLVNLNMIRHPQVLSALIDDDELINDRRFVGTATDYLDDATGDPSGRKWWAEFLKSRESRFTKTASTSFQPDLVTNLYLPGTANGRPFRGLDVVGPRAYDPAALPITAQDSPLEQTILRSLPIDSFNFPGNDGPPNQSRRLFEIGNDENPTGGNPEHFGDITVEVTKSTLHPSARYRLLSKLMNNTTTRSNSFAVYVTVQYYEAAEQNLPNQSAPALRIGGRLEDTPTHRGFFVVDRTGAIEQMKTLATNAGTGTISVPVANQATFPVSPNSFSFQKNTDTTGSQSKQNGIRWKDLVLFRQTLN